MSDEDNAGSTVPVGVKPGQVALRRGVLVIFEGPDTGRTVAVEAGTVTLGSSPRADFRLSDPSVSKSHASLGVQGSEFTLTDLGSTNGTFVNGTRIREAFLKPGDVVALGNSKLRFEPRTEDVRIPPSTHSEFGPVYGQSLAMRQVFGILERVARTDSSVLVRGETGTGKDLLARALHEASGRRQGPFVVFDCSAVSQDLVGSELFGHVEGAFTGANRRHQGVFEFAKGGTVFIDEIGELPLDLQPKLLRVLESREVRPLGSNQSVPVDARVVAATHRDLDHMVKEGCFRQDLYYRLAVVTVELPPLRDRRDDVAGLAERLVRRIAGDTSPVTLAPDALEALSAYHWPGNVRELRNVLERGLAMGAGDRLEARDLLLSRTAPPPGSTGPGLEGKTLEEIEREVIRITLARTGGNQKEAARLLGIHRNTMRDKMKRHGLVVEKDDGSE